MAVATLLLVALVIDSLPCCVLGRRWWSVPLEEGELEGTSDGE